MTAASGFRCTRAARPRPLPAWQPPAMARMCSAMVPTPPPHAPCCPAGRCTAPLMLYNEGEKSCGCSQQCHWKRGPQAGRDSPDRMHAAPRPTPWPPAPPAPPLVATPLPAPHPAGEVDAPGGDREKWRANCGLATRTIRRPRIQAGVVHGVRYTGRGGGCRACTGR